MLNPKSQFPMTNKIPNPNFQDLRKFIIDEASAGTRLDRFLVTKLIDRSRSQIQKEIKEGAWQMDGKRVTPHYALKEGQTIEEVPGADRRSLKTAQLDYGKDNKGGLSEVKVIAETEGYLVIDKPAGIAVHGGFGIRGTALADLLLEKYPELGGVGEDPVRPGIVHRLDKDVSGVMVVARTQAAFADLKKQFKERRVKKEYTALVYGTFINDEGKIELPLVRSEKGKKRGTMKALPRGDAAVAGTRDARTEFTVMQRFPRTTLIAAFPHTGRTHQIRVHFRAIGHPIVGDRLYRSAKVLKVNVVLERPFLHATKITFYDLLGEEKTYASALPDDLEKALASMV